MMRNFDIDALRTMVSGVDLGSFSRAASQLGRSQSAVSMQLKKLEDQAGKPLFTRKGRGLVPTEAGEALLGYARRIIALNDEAAVSLGAAASAATVRVGLPQDFFEDVLPAVLKKFSQERPGGHIEVRAGRNHVLEEEVLSGRLDAAIAFFRCGSERQGHHIADLPVYWYGARHGADRMHRDPLPLVMFDHPCLFRQQALQSLDRSAHKWRMALTTPSLPGVWAALRSGHGISARTAHNLPFGIGDVREAYDLPEPRPIALRMLSSSTASASARDLRDILLDVTTTMVAPLTSTAA